MNKLKLVLGTIVGFIFTVFSSCERIDAGHVGIKVNMYGSNKGVDGITECTGWVVYNPISTKIYEFPTFMQHKEYKEDNSFVVNSKDGSEFHVSPMINYSIKRDQVPYIFAKYRRDIEDIENGFLKTTIYDAFRMTANAYTAEDLVSNRQEFETKVRAKLDSNLTKEGFTISQLTSNLGYPESFKNAIIAKNNAVQAALMAENQVKTAEAQSKIKVATAQGDAEAMLTQAKAQSEAYKLKCTSITPMLLQQMWIEKWNGVLPTTSLGSNSPVMLNMNK
jgi:regulator of protease activity HflC (stomatin/prohibitin superfamily)